MKTFTFLFTALILSTTIVSAQSVQDKADSTYTSTWVQALDWLGPTVVPTQGTIDAIPRKEIVADSVSGFDAQGCIFDDEWSKYQGAGNQILNPVGLAGTNSGASDFEGAFKVLYDDANIYVLLRYNDDDITGNEMVELTWAPYLKLYNPKFKKLTANYFRYRDFGAAKATFGKSGYKNSLLIAPTISAYDIFWSGTTADLTANLYLDDKTEPNSKVVKQIITLGYAAFTGNARQNFDPSIWRTLNGGKGISFDLKVRDADTDDANEPTPDPLSNTRSQDYWWNSTVNDGYVVTYLSGLLAPQKISTGIHNATNEKSIFGNITTNQIQLNKIANVTIFDTLGKIAMSVNNTTSVKLSVLAKGVYIVKANNQTIKIIR